MLIKPDKSVRELRKYGRKLTKIHESIEWGIKIASGHSSCRIAIPGSNAILKSE